MQKKALRERFLRLRKEGFVFDAATFETHLRDVLVKRAPETVGLYCPIGQEIDVLGMLADDAAYRDKIALPVIDDLKKGLMHFARFEGYDCLKEGFRGILEPKDAPLVVPELLIIPALCADASGFRLGYGGGFYDRYLASHENLYAVGVLAEAFFVNSLPAQSTDYRLPPPP
ncbi:MAG TPA: 5-formyltetrahydrofolate cyclo-ligase, partial [Sutterella sp.]|nr:5-formyltetrahydrofolate cyclo-ligase [Sutterella sp.]